MTQENRVTVTPFHLIGRDDRGVTADFSLSRQQKDFIFLERKAGSLSGNTYHEGKNAGTNPKTFVLLCGEIELSYRFIDGGTKHILRIAAPSLIEVEPRVVHAVLALTDIMILEANSIDDVASDKIKELV